MKSSNNILNAVISKLQAEKDEVIVQLDLIINKNLSDKGVSGLVDQATLMFKKLSEIDLTIETVLLTIENNKSNQFIQQIGELSELISKNNKNTENNGDNP